MEIVFATGNIDKLNQVKLMLSDFDLMMPKDFGYDNFEVIEDGKTLKENAYKKAKSLYDLIKIPTFADDTGLFVESLENRPGIYSHRYAGENASYKDNREKLLDELSDKDNRDAYFKTCICFINNNGDDHYFEGVLFGTITKKEKGNYDFGYDKIFMPKGFNKTLGEMSDDEINKISHRSIAINKLKKFLKENYL